MTTSHNRITIPPSIEYGLDRHGPNVFDCRWNTPRRMGIGDKLIAVAAIQQVESAGYSVAAIANKCDEDIFGAGRIKLFRSEPSANVIPWTDHVMCIPIGYGEDECREADTQAHHAVERALWGIGLHRFAKQTPAFDLKHQGKKKPETVSWSPIEISRAPNRILPSEWENILNEMIFRDGGIRRIELLCGIQQQPAAWDIVKQFRATLAKKISIVSASNFGEWVDMVASAGKVLSANTGTMWVAIGVKAELTVVQRPSTFPHSAMWQARKEWGISIIEKPQDGCPYASFGIHPPSTPLANR